MIDKVISKETCVSCGICKGSCPFGAIKFERNNRGQYLPCVDENICKNCGICVDVCPGCKVHYEKQFEDLGEPIPENLFVGNIIKIYNARIKDTELRNQCTCGGMITGLVDYLLKSEQYSCAFLCSEYNYSEFITSNRVQSVRETQQSRYIPVSHEKLIEYALKHKEEKIIVVGTGCAISGIINAINRFKLNRDNFLILGLFCACTLNYNTFEYFKLFSKRPLKKLKWRSKKGKEIYPYGMVRLEYDKDAKMLQSVQKAYLKKYMALERCTYCTDLLNILSDVSFGDNNSSSKDGESNTVIIRTQRGLAALDKFKNFFEIIEECELEELGLNSVLNERKSRKRYANIFKVQKGVDLYQDMDDHYPNIGEMEVNDIEKLKKKIESLKWGEDKNYRKLFVYLQIRYFLSKCKKVVKR